MKFAEFFDSVNNLVKEWQPADEQAGATPRNALRRIYDDIREQAVYDLAVAVEQRNRALTQLHKQYVKGGKPSTRPLTKGRATR